MTTTPNDPSGSPLATAAVSALAQACAQLAKTRDDFRAQALRDDLPAWPPDTPEAQARELAIESVCAIYLGERSSNPSPSGVVCISEETAVLAQAFAQAKTTFAACVGEIKGALPPAAKNVTLTKLLTDDSHGPYVRDKRVQKALARVHFADVDLTAAYRRVRLYHQAEAVSFFWQVNRREVLRVTPAQAKAMVEKRFKRPEQANELAMALQLLATHRKDLARVRNQPTPQLRANVYYYHDGERRRELIPTPIPVLVVGDALPRRRWPGSVDNKIENLPRTGENRVADTPLIPALGLYPYAKDVH